MFTIAKHRGVIASFPKWAATSTGKNQKQEANRPARTWLGHGTVRPRKESTSHLLDLNCASRPLNRADQRSPNLLKVCWHFSRVQATSEDRGAAFMVGLLQNSVDPWHNTGYYLGPLASRPPPTSLVEVVDIDAQTCEGCCLQGSAECGGGRMHGKSLVRALPTKHAQALLPFGETGSLKGSFCSALQSLRVKANAEIDAPYNHYNCNC